MNVDTDTQYAFTRPVADHMFKNYDGVLKIDGEVGNKKVYDPRAWGKAAEAGMAARVVEACQDLRSAGTRIATVMRRGPARRDIGDAPARTTRLPRDAPAREAGASHRAAEVAAAHPALACLGGAGRAGR